MNTRPFGSISQSVVGNTPNLASPSGNRQSVLIQGGKGMLESNNSSQQQLTERNNILRSSANSQIAGNRNKFQYHKSKQPTEQGNKVGEYMTKDARMIVVKEVKSSHFQLGYTRDSKTVDQRHIEDEQIKQKWNPKQVIAKANLGKSNWSHGLKSGFEGTTQAGADYKNHGSSYDPTAKAKRLALVNELRKSNLPSQNFDFPKSTAQESYNKSASAEDMAYAAQQRQEVNAKNRKPNFSLGNFKSDYQSQNSGSLTKPMSYSFDSKAIKKQVENNRQSNFNLSFEQGSQFETDKGSLPYKMAAKEASAERISKKGASNVHQVQIGNARMKSDYQSLTRLQQAGHKDAGMSRNGNTGNYTEVRQQIQARSKELRSSHFHLGGDNSVAQANSAMMYQAPPTNLLTSGAAERKIAVEKIQKSNFTIKQAHGAGPNAQATTQSQANNQIRQGQFESGQYSMRQGSSKPADSIKFGQAVNYTSEAKSNFLGEKGHGNKNERVQMKDKYTKPNINLGTMPQEDRMMTVAQQNDQSLNNQYSSLNQSTLSTVAQEQRNRTKEFGSQMRSAQFKLGSILPESNNYKPTQLDKVNSGSIGLNAQYGYKPTIRAANQPSKPQQVSAGNNIAIGIGNFRTINQQFTNWIQPAAASIKQ